MAESSERAPTPDGALCVALVPDQPEIVCDRLAPATPWPATTPLEDT